MNAGALAGLIKGVRFPGAEAPTNSALFTAEPSFHPTPLCFLMNLSFFKDRQL